MASTTRRMMMHNPNYPHRRNGQRTLLPYRFFGAVLIGAFLCSLPPQSHAQDKQAGASNSLAPQFTTTNGDSPISAGDLLAVSVFDTPEFSGTMRVSNEGNLSLPLIGSVHVAGLTAPAAAKVIRDMLIQGNFLKDPQVSIGFVDFINQSALVLGEVRTPGTVPVLGARTLWQTIGAAGGVTPTAGERVTIIRRGDPTHPQVVMIKWGSDLGNQPNPQIAPGDTVQVSRAGIAYVVGQVGRQGGFPIPTEGMTLAQVIALAQGVKYTAKASKGRLIRKTPDGRLVVEVDIPSVLEGKEPDIALRNDDIVFVPNSTSKVMITRGVESAITIGSSLLIYNVH